MRRTFEGRCRVGRLLAAADTQPEPISTATPTQQRLWGQALPLVRLHLLEHHA